MMMMMMMKMKIGMYLAEGTWPKAAKRLSRFIDKIDIGSYENKICFVQMSTKIVVFSMPILPLCFDFVVLFFNAP